VKIGGNQGIEILLGEKPGWILICDFDERLSKPLNIIDGALPAFGHVIPFLCLPVESTVACD
jgi:hypothetical protein